MEIRDKLDLVANEASIFTIGWRSINTASGFDAASISIMGQLVLRIGGRRFALPWRSILTGAKRLVVPTSTMSTTMMSTSGIPAAAAMPGATVVFTTMTVPVATITMPIHSAEATTHTKSKHRATTVIPRRSGIDRFVTRIITIAVTHWAA
jgi:hypothetical protein